MCLIADTPEGTTKLELRLEARFALRLLYDVSIVAPLPVLMMLRDAIVSDPEKEFTATKLRAW